MKRICVLEFHAADSEIPEYILYLAKELKKITDMLFVVINLEKGKEVHLEELDSIVDEVVVRDDIDFDAGAFKYALSEVIGWNQIREYDELILVNDSCYGPIYPLEKVFDTMKDKKYDFWAITEREEFSDKKTGKFIPYHVQPYFLVIRKRMLADKKFEAYWKSLPSLPTFRDAVYKYELKFTEYFNRLGYKSGAYIDDKYFPETVANEPPAVYFDTYNLVVGHRSPFLKKKTFFFDQEIITNANMGENARKTLGYIEKSTDYDSNLIWKDLIKRRDINQLKTILHLNYICQSSPKADKSFKDESAVVVFSNDINKCKMNKRFTEIGKYTTVFFADEEDLTKKLCSYEYVCLVFADVNDLVSLEMLFENALQNPSYVGGIIDILKKGRLLGMLTTPTPYHGENFSKRFKFDLGKRNKLKKIAKDICSQVKIPNAELFTVGNACWCKKDAISPLIEKIQTFKEMAFQNINLTQTIIPYVAQKQGYYSGELTNVKYASVICADYLYMLQSLVSNTLISNGVNSLYSVESKINKGINTFVQGLSKVYIYGAGDFGYRCLKYLNHNNLKTAGFIVSDGYRRNKKFLWFDIYELSEIVFDESIGVIVACDNDKLHTFIENLSARGVRNYITFREDAKNEC